MAKTKPVVDLVDALIVLGACRESVADVRAWSRRQRPEDRRASALLSYAQVQWLGWLSWLRDAVGCIDDSRLAEATLQAALRCVKIRARGIGRRRAAQARRRAAQERLRAAARARGITW